MTPSIGPIFIAGPTAVGKSAVALLLAEQIGGEIISVDSMQVYRGLDIGTAKPSPVERQRIRHYGIDVADLTETFDAARFVDLARQAVSEAASRRRIPIFCGGTGLYFKAYLDGLGDTPAADPNLRQQLEAAPLSDLLGELASRDPVTFEKIDRQNPRRVIRAIEVIRLTGKPYSAQRATWSASTRHEDRPTLIGLCRPVEELQRRIDVRVDEMFRAGLVAETERLLKHGLAENRNALQALGYRQVVEHLQGGPSLTETVAAVKGRTRKFAKRQMTWFRRQLNVKWIELSSRDDAAAIASELARSLEQ